MGEGKAEFDISAPEESQFPMVNKLVAFNGGTSGGKTTIFIHSYLGPPVSAAVVIRVEAWRALKGAYGLEARAKVPKIAEGYGSMISLALKLGREFVYKGRPSSFLSLECADGQIFVADKGVFEDGTIVTASEVRPCTPKG